MEKRRTLAAIGFLTVCAVAVAMLTTRNIGLTTDSMQYAAVADQVLAGHGVRTPLLALGGGEVDPATGTQPFMVQPPFLPLLFAAMGGVSADRLWPGQAINIVAHVVTVLCCFLIARRLTGDLVFAILAAAAVLWAPAVLAVTGKLWTEALFAALFMSSVMFLQASRRSPRRDLCLVMAGLAAAAAFATRWAGVALAPLLLWECFITWHERSLREGIRVFLAPRSGPSWPWPDYGAEILRQRGVCVRTPPTPASSTPSPAPSRGSFRCSARPSSPTVSGLMPR